MTGVIDGAPVETANSRRVAVVAGTCLVGWFVLVYGLAAILRATGARPGPGAQSSLEHSSPPARDASGRFLGFSRFDAAELNRIEHGKELRELRFVGPDVPSTGPDVVSVNIVDDFTWGAAALSDQTDRCYLMLRVIDRDRTDLGTTHYALLPKGEPCLGASAVPDRVTASDWPDAGAYGPGALTSLIVLLLLLGPMAAVLAWAVVEIRKVEDRGRATLRWLGPIALSIVAWWVACAGAL